MNKTGHLKGFKLFCIEFLHFPSELPIFVNIKNDNSNR